MFSCLQILEAFLWFVLITLLNVTLIILTLSVSRLLNLLLRLVAFLLFLNPQCLASISRWITASSSWKRFCLFVCRALSSIMVICMLTAIRLLLTFRSEERFSRNAETDLVCRLLLEKKKLIDHNRLLLDAYSPPHLRDTRSAAPLGPMAHCLRARDGPLRA